LIIILLNL